MRDAVDDFDSLLPKLTKRKGDFRTNLGKMVSVHRFYSHISTANSTFQMNDFVSNARGNDIKGLLDKGLVYIALDLPPGQKLDIPATLPKEQARGHNNIILSRLLCPIRLLNEFDQDHDGYALVRRLFAFSLTHL